MVTHSSCRVLERAQAFQTLRLVLAPAGPPACRGMARACMALPCRATGAMRFAGSVPLRRLTVAGSSTQRRIVWRELLAPRLP